MFEKRWAAVSPQPFTSNGTTNGQLTVVDSSVFKVKQQINLSSSALPNLNLEVKSIPDDITILVGPPAANIFSYSDISAYLVVDGANIWAIEQKRSSVPVEEINRAVYEEEPVVATRVIMVDKHGDKFDESNPLPVNATVSVVVPPVTVDIDALTPATRPDPDSVLMAGSEDGTKAGLKHAARIDSDLDLRVGISDGANKALVDALGQLSVTDAPVAIALASLLTQLQSGGIIIGTEDGTPTGTPHVFVNNLRTMILASSNRVSAMVYLDPTSKQNRRIDRIDYTSATFPGFTARKQFSYTLIGNEYVINNPGVWSII